MAGQVLGSLLLSFGIMASVFSITTSRFMFFRGPTSAILLIAGVAMTAIGIIVIYATREKPNLKHFDKLDNQYPCPICQGKDFTWSNMPQTRFRQQVGYGKPVYSRVCIKCGNMQQFVDRTNI